MPWNFSSRNENFPTPVMGLAVKVVMQISQMIQTHPLIEGTCWFIKTWVNISVIWYRQETTSQIVTGA